MLRKLCSLILLVIFSSTTHADIHYHLKHDKDIIHIKADFRSNCSVSEKLYIPGEIWGANYSEQIKNIKITKSDSRDISIEYDIVNLPTSLFTTSFGDKHYHYIKPNKFYLFGIGAFVSPQKFCADSDKVIIHLSSSEISFASNISPFYNQKDIILNFKDLDDLVILGAKDFSFIKDDTNNIDLLIWSDDPSFTSRLKNITYPILKQQQVFWQDYNNTKLAIFIPDPSGSNRNRWGGTVLHNTIVAFINPKTNTDLDLTNLISHEAMHLWFGENNLRGPKWFTEGFSDYYMDKIALSESEFLNNYNDKLALYFSSPFKNVSNDDIDKNFFKIQALQKLIYWKGYLIAGQLDSIIDLDSALKHQIKNCNSQKNSCDFSLESLLNYAGNISQKQKMHIKNLINNFDAKYLNTHLFKSQKLAYKQIESMKYKIDLIDALNKCQVSGKDLHLLDSRYNKQQNYELMDIIRDCKQQLHLKIKLGEQQEEILVPKANISITIPVYLR